MRSGGISTTIGKFSKDGDDPDLIVGEYQKCSTSLKNGLRKAGNFYLSLKPPALEFNFNHVKSIAATAFRNGHGVHFDSHDHILAEPSLQLLKKLMAHTGYDLNRSMQWHFGLTLPSRWKRSLSDAHWAAENGIRVRLVKGEFKARHSSDEMDPQKNFITLIDYMAGGVAEVAIATHDYNLARKAIARARKNGTKVELELLLGMPSTQLVALSKEMQVPLRFYVAYGDTLTIYAIRHFLLHPEKMMRPGFTEALNTHRAKLSKIMHEL